MCCFFLLQKFDLISQLRHSYDKGPFCVTQLILTYVISLPLYIYGSFPFDLEFSEVWLS